MTFSILVSSGYTPGSEIVGSYGSYISNFQRQLLDEWTKKLWYIYIHNGIHYSSIKGNALESVLMQWMNLEPIIQSEVSQKEKNKDHVLTHTYGL